MHLQIIATYLVVDGRRTSRAESVKYSAAPCSADIIARGLRLVDIKC